MRALRHVVHDEGGMSLTELLVGSTIAVITLTIVVTWISLTSGVDLRQEDDFEALNALNFARSNIERELRFADGVVSSGANVIVVDSDGTLVTWAIASGTLVRYEDGNASVARVLLERVDETASEITFDPSTSTVTIVLTVEVDQGFAATSRSIRTRVNMRNT